MKLTRTVTTTDVRFHLSDILNEVSFGDARIGVTRNGKLAAVFISPTDLAELEHLEEDAREQNTDLNECTTPNCRCQNQ